jgi:GNAT superfamily N-acetyltransferase
MNSLSEKKFIIYSWESPEYWKAIEIRRIVLRFPLGKNYTMADFESEKDEEFFGCFTEQGKCMATISAKKIHFSTWKMRQFAVHPSFQKIGIGQQMVHFYERAALEKGIKKIEFHARKTAVEFYKKLGYAVISNEFLEVGIPHFKMEKVL